MEAKMPKNSTNAQRSPIKKRTHSQSEEEACLGMDDKAYGSDDDVVRRKKCNTQQTVLQLHR